MAWLGPFMLFGMAAGLATNATLDSTINVQKTCDAINEAKQNQSQVEKDYNALLYQAGSIAEQISDYQLSLKNHRGSLERATKLLKENFNQTQLKTIISLCVFLITLIIGFIFKYFNVFGNLWQLIVKN